MSRDIVPPQVTGRIERELSDQLTMLGQHPNAEIGNEHEDPGPREPPAEADVVQPRVVTQRDHPPRAARKARKAPAPVVAA